MEKSITKKKRGILAHGHWRHANNQNDGLVDMRSAIREKCVERQGYGSLSGGHP